MSEPTGKVYSAIAAVAAEMATVGIAKDKTNQMQHYNFRGIDDVYNSLAPLLAKHKLVILPRCTERGMLEHQTAKGGTLFKVTVKAEFDFVSAADGSRHTVAMYGEAMDSGDKATNKAMSAAYKYACFQAFCIPVDVEDADAETPPPVQATSETDARWDRDANAPSEDNPFEPSDDLPPAQKTVPQPAGKTYPKCPNCGEPMAKRKRKADGSPFWGCTAWRPGDPNACKGALPVT